MKKIMVLLVLFVAVGLFAVDFSEELGITPSQERHILGCEVVNLGTMYFTDHPLLSASMGLFVNCGLEIYDHSETGKWDYEDLRTGAYCFVGNILINYTIQIIKKQSNEDHKPKRYDPMLRNDRSKATIINLTTLSMLKKVDEKEEE